MNLHQYVAAPIDRSTRKIISPRDDNKADTTLTGFSRRKDRCNMNSQV